MGVSLTSPVPSVPFARRWSCRSVSRQVRRARGGPLARAWYRASAACSSVGAAARQVVQVLVLRESLLLAAACSEESAAPDRAPIALPEPAPTADPFAIDEDEIEDAFLAAERAASSAPEADRCARRRTAAELARVFAVRTGDRSWLERARENLRDKEHCSRAAACDADLALFEIEARDAIDLPAAYAVAYRIAWHYRENEAEGCVQRARRAMRVLDAFKPSDDTLDAIEASGEAEPAAAETVDAWIRERATDATLEAVSVYGARSEVARVVLQFDAVALFTRGEVPARDGRPRRAYVDLARTTIGPGVRSAHDVSATGIRGIRIASREGGVTRVVFELEERAQFSLFALPDPFRLVLDVGAPDSSATDAHALRLVVLDPGHGGRDDRGARHGDLTEADLTLDIAQRVATVLERTLPDTRIMLTRRNDRAVSLEERVAFANSAGADLFVSIHLNGWDEPVEHGGVTTFVLDTANDEQEAALAARENGTSTVDVSAMQRLLASFHREGQVTASRSAAELVHASMLRSAREVLPDLGDRGVKSAMFFVLVGARMPAILVEASFLTQPDEARALATEAYRQALARGIAEGIVSYGSAAR
jgi:N-acetylmuramoyl-L-alanine amidase